LTRAGDVLANVVQVAETVFAVLAAGAAALFIAAGAAFASWGLAPGWRFVVFVVVALAVLAVAAGIYRLTAIPRFGHREDRHVR
jgi:hypothetical protein